MGKSENSGFSGTIDTVDHRTVFEIGSCSYCTLKIVSCFTQYLLITHWINNLLGNSFEGYKIGTVSDISYQIDFDLES